MPTCGENKGSIENEVRPEQRRRWPQYFSFRIMCSTAHDNARLLCCSTIQKHCLYSGRRWLKRFLLSPNWWCDTDYCEITGTSCLSWEVTRCKLCNHTVASRFLVPIDICALHSITWVKYWKDRLAQAKHVLRSTCEPILPILYSRDRVLCANVNWD